MSRSEASRRRRRRALLLAALVLLLGYPVLLAASTRAGLVLGLRRDVTADRDLVRALSYAGNQDGWLAYGSDNPRLTVAPLDDHAVNAQLGVPDNGAGAGAPPVAAVPTAPPTSAAPAPVAPAPVAAPPRSAGPTAPPKPAPAPPPKASPPPPKLCPGAPTGRGQLNLHATAARREAAVSGATVRIFFQGCLVATDSTKADGRATRINTLGNGTYTYVVSHAGFKDAHGSFVARATSETKVEVDMSPA